MADQLLQVVTANIGVVNNAILPLFKVQSGFGGLRVTSCEVTFLTAGTAQLYLVDGGTAGTLTTGGTLASSGGTAYSAKTPIAMSVTDATAYLAEGRYLCVKENNVGSSVTVTEVAIKFKWGK